MKKINRSLAAVVVILATLGLTACNDKTAKALRDTSVLLNSTAKVVSTLHDQGYIADASYPDIVRAQIEVVKTHKEAIAFFRSVDKITPENKGVALLRVDAVLLSLERLQQQGLLHIKDPTKQAFLVGTLAGIRANVAVIRAFIEQIQKPTRIPVPNTA
ncbi:MAG: hypothetical protein U0Y68_18410 [Blastocatellia bacterium]